ncbi:hypothetical protein SAMN02990966_04906 [Rhodospirillales bacterium URHD0017]|nr:hypothetical protein SAMN02990966_04906 [Rhodospirillales bacterium URHD0017]
MTAKQRALKAKIDDKLDQALQDSFPASDPVSFLQPAPAKSGDRKLPVVEAARDSAEKSKATRRERPDDRHRA